MIKPSILITGASGFLGKFVLEKIDSTRYLTIFCLTRKKENIQLPTPRPENIEILKGDLLQPSTYDNLLKRVDTVIHLGAMTGKVSPNQYFKVNSYATMLLLDRCKKSGVKNFLFVSSIAVSFKNKYRYFYAHSKEQAEEYVKNSGLNFTILRPTMIMGKNSPVFNGLAQLSGLPFIILFGKGKSQIQPIHVEDVAEIIDRIEGSSRYKGETFELGGPEIISIKSFMRKIASHLGKKKPKTVHIPIGLMIFSLSIFERIVYDLLPLTVGQMASFSNDSTAQENSFTQKYISHMKNLDFIISDSLAPLNDDINEWEDIPVEIKKECKTFSRYLVSQSPDAYVIKKYYLCHQKINFIPMDFHDGLILSLGSIHPFLTRSADVYSKFFRPRSVIRKKLAYLMAILEVSPPFYRHYDTGDGLGMVAFVLKLAWRGAGLSLHLLLSVIFLLPLQVLNRFMRKKKEEEKK